MRARSWLLVAGVIVGLAAPGPAASEPTSKAVAEAKRHYERAETHYELQEYDEAIAAYRAAYELSKAPALLFNIAQAYRLKEDFPQAIDFYRSYLRLTPSARNRVDVERLIDECTRLQEVREREAREREAREQEAREREARARRAEEQARAEEARRRQEEERRRASETRAPGRSSSGGLRIAGIATGATGLALVGAGAAFGLRARASWQDINALAAAGGTWTPGDSERWEQAEADEVRAVVLAGVGGAALVTGGVLAWVGWRQGREPPAISASASPAGGELVLTWTF